MSRVTAALWLLRAGWAALPLALVPAAGQALDGARPAVQAVAAAGLWVGWATGLVALLVLSTAGLTTLRLLAPAAPAVAVTAAVGGAGPAASGAAVALAAAVALLAFTGEVGKACVQGSAYGDERRHLLRPPGVLLFGPLVAFWVLLAAAVVSGPLLLATERWVLGALLTAVGWPLAVVLARRFHRLSRRWLVFVPAGLVVHDDLALAESAMLPAADVQEVALALAGTEAFDLTVRALGPAVEVRLRRHTTLVLPGSLRQRQGRSVHAAAFLCSPTRPGQVLADAAARGLAAVPPPSTQVSPRS